MVGNIGIRRLERPPKMGNLLQQSRFSQKPCQEHQHCSGRPPHFPKEGKAKTMSNLKCKSRFARVRATFLYRCEAGKMSILGDNGRNRIAAPTHGHEWRAGATVWANWKPLRCGHTIYRHG